MRSNVWFIRAAMAAASVAAASAPPLRVTQATVAQQMPSQTSQSSILYNTTYGVKYGGALSAADAIYASMLWPTLRHDLLQGNTTGMCSTGTCAPYIVDVMSGALGDVLVASGAQARGLTISLVGSSPGVGPASLCFYSVAVFSGDTIDMRPAPALGQSPPFSVTTLWLYPPSPFTFEVTYGPPYRNYVDSPHPRQEVAAVLQLAAFPSSLGLVAFAYPSRAGTDSTMARVASAFGSPAYLLVSNSGSAAVAWVGPVHNADLAGLVATSVSPPYTLYVYCNGGDRCGTSGTPSRSWYAVPTPSMTSCTCLVEKLPTAGPPSGAALAPSPLHCAAGRPGVTAPLSSIIPGSTSSAYPHAASVTSQRVTNASSFVSFLASVVPSDWGSLAWTVVPPKYVGRDAAGGLYVVVNVVFAWGPLSSSGGTRPLSSLPATFTPLFNLAHGFPADLVVPPNAAFLLNLTNGTVPICASDYASPAPGYGLGVSRGTRTFCACRSSDSFPTLPGSLLDRRCAPQYGRAPGGSCEVNAPPPVLLTPSRSTEVAEVALGCHPLETLAVTNSICVCKASSMGPKCQYCALGYVRSRVSYSSYLPCATVSTVCGPYGTRSLDGESCACRRGRFGLDCSVCHAGIDERAGGCGVASVGCSSDPAPNTTSPYCQCAQGWAPQWWSSFIPNDQPCNACARGYGPASPPTNMTCIRATCQSNFDDVVFAITGICQPLSGLVLGGLPGKSCAPGFALAYSSKGAPACTRVAQNSVCSNENITSCRCHLGWSPATSCSTCADGYGGPACVRCPDCGMGSCTVLDYNPSVAFCACGPGQAGDTCDHCASGYIEILGQCMRCPACWSTEICADGGAGLPVCRCAPGRDPAAQCARCLPRSFFYNWVTRSCDATTSADCDPAYGLAISEDTCQCTAPGELTAIAAAGRQTRCLPCPAGCPLNSACFTRDNVGVACECLPGYIRQVPYVDSLTPCVMMPPAAAYAPVSLVAFEVDIAFQDAPGWWSVIAVLLGALFTMASSVLLRKPFVVPSMLLYLLLSALLLARSLMGI